MTKQLPFRFGAEVYTCFMNQDGKTHAGRLGHMIEVIAEAGFSGIQPIYSWMGDLSDAGRLEAKLKEQGIELAALALALDWNGTEETEAERVEADQAIRLLQRFPGAILCTVQKPTGRHDLTARRRSLVNLVNRVSRRATEKGVPCSFHPNSPPTSITRTEEDYRVILEALDPAATGWTPDVGHLINGGMDPLLKAITGGWALRANRPDRTRPRRWRMITPACWTRLGFNRYGWLAVRWEVPLRSNWPSVIRKKYARWC